KWIKKQTKNYKVTIVDDGSIDNTAKIAQQENITLLQHSINLGKGAALKTGCDYAYRKGAQNLVVLDADAQHDPNNIPEFIKKLTDHDIVFSYREQPTTMPFILRFGNRFISSITTFLYGLKLKDTQSGYRAFTAQTYRKIRWQAADYSMESEMIANVGKHRLKYAQIPIKTIYSDKYKGTTVVDGIKIVLRMITWRLFK
ncbi:MAG: glycosyltransferase family 2 protein, partial [Nanoarchaeota archaeon]|nr:glycosyltransferase family 2 protein [Nanoarchaeota archaeon]